MKNVEVIDHGHKSQLTDILHCLVEHKISLSEMLVAQISIFKELNSSDVSIAVYNGTQNHLLVQEDKKKSGVRQSIVLRSNC